MNYGKICAIYELVSVDTGERYVGSSLCLVHRLRTHRARLKRGCHTNWRLKRAYRRHGWEGFQINVLEECTPATLQACEQRYIDSGNYAYNLSSTAERSSMSLEAREKMAVLKKARARKIEGKLVSEWADITGVPATTISARLNLGWDEQRAVHTPILDTTKPRLLTYNGETLTLRQIAKKYGWSHSALFKRLKEGMSLEAALISPRRHRWWNHVKVPV